MEHLPLPPPAEELAERTPPDLVAVTVVTPLFRVHATAGAHPSRWGALRDVGPLPTARFDHHDGGPGRAVVYLGLAVRTCVAEYFQATRFVDTARGAPWVSAFRCTRTVRLLDLTGAWPTRAGASQSISAGSRARARQWSVVIYGAYPDVEGLWYRSSMDGGAPAVALYDRAADAVPARPVLHLPLADPVLRPALVRMARELGYGLTAP